MATMQFSVSVRNGRADQIESVTGASAKLYLYSGALPANCAAADPSGLLATINLPSDWMNAAGSGQKTLLGTWSASASGTGVAASFRIKDNAGTTCHVQGDVSTVAAGTGALQLDNTNITSGQTVQVTGFTITEGNA